MSWAATVLVGFSLLSASPAAIAIEAISYG